MKFLSLEDAKTFKEVDILVEHYNKKQKILELKEPVYTENQIDKLYETNRSLIKKVINYQICKLVGAENIEGFSKNLNIMAEQIGIDSRYKIFSSYGDYYFIQYFLEGYKEKRKRISSIKYNIQKESHSQKLDMYKAYSNSQQLKEILIPRFFKLIEDEIKKYYKEVNAILKKIDKKIEYLEEYFINYDYFDEKTKVVNNKELQEEINLVREKIEESYH